MQEVKRRRIHGLYAFWSHERQRRGASLLLTHAAGEAMNDERATGRRLAGADGGSGAKAPWVRGLGRNTPGPVDGTGYSPQNGTYVMG
jgi:hypothetical protein